MTLDIKVNSIPKSECLKDVLKDYYHIGKKKFARSINRQDKVMIAAHGNSLRAIIKHLDGISDDDIAAVNVPTGIPLLYELDENLNQ